jgi:hypothetical protein
MEDGLSTVKIRLIRIKNTLKLGKIYISEHILDKALSM